MLVRSWSLRTAFRVWALIFSLFPCALLATFLTFFLSHRLHEGFESELGRTLLLQQQFLDTWIGDRQRDMIRRASLLDLDQGPDSMKRSFRKFLDFMPEFESLGIIGPDGAVQVDTMGKTGLFLGDRPYFKAGSEGRPAVSDILTSRATGYQAVIFAAPVMRPDGGFRGVLFAQVSFKVIEKVVGDTALDFGGRTILLDRTGRRIAGSGAPGEDGAGKRPHPAMAAMRPDGESFAFTDPGGIRMMAVARPLLSTGWVLVGEAPLAALKGQVRRAVAVVLCAGLVAFLAAIPLVIRMSRRLERILGPLTGHAKAISQGRYDLAPPNLGTGSVPRDFAVLATAFATMQDKIASDMSLLDSMARTDSLTGLPNRRHLMEDGARLIGISARAGLPCSCLLIDVDHFKAINDRYGHATGDGVLAGLAGVLRRADRGADLLGRLGGEEFLAVCAETGLREATLLAERLKKSVAELEGLLPDGMKITVSIGVACLETVSGDFTALFDRLVLAADQAMYRAKAEGRDRVVAAECCLAGEKKVPERS